MTSAALDAQPRFLSALTCAAPAMVVAALLLLPFLNTPFTIDDPIFLREAQHVLKDPLHPQAIDMVWSADVTRRASDIQPGGVAAPYLLVPMVMAGNAEWAGHLTQLILFEIAIFAAALAALRLRMDTMQAGLAAMLVATCPAALGMAETVMPDIAATMFVILGMERLICWRDRRKWSAGLLVAVWLTLAALTRPHTIVILPAAFVLLLDGIARDEIRASFAHFPVRFVPLLLIPIAFLASSYALGDPDASGEGILATMRFPGGLILHNAMAFATHWLLLMPLTFPWLVIRFKALEKSFLLIAAFAAAVLAIRYGWLAFAVAATAVALADIAWDAVQRRDRVQFGLWLWLWMALPIVIYVHLPSKYLLPSLPAAAMLLVRRLSVAYTPAKRWLIPATAAAGAMLGILVLIGIRDLAQIQKRAVAELVIPHIQRGERVWFAGHWGFQWYAENAGATPVTLEPPLPQQGDVIVVSYADFPRFASRWTARRVIQSVTYPGNGVGRVMDAQAGAGFFSNPWGFLPWVWGKGAANRFEVWQVE
jgi:hypothetical protein